MDEPTIRPMTLADIEAVMEVETATYASPWQRHIFYQEIAQNFHAHYFVLELGGLVIGYAGMWVVMDDAQITNIAILPAYRGRKFGDRLFRFLLGKAIMLGAEHLSLEVRVSNHIAQRMYRKFGLVKGGIRKNYYTDNQEDAMVMWVTLK
ncbi:ribosomal protein S18-alanine N-acetyltransferase [Virgibacillus sp. 179-BFC.A HS]|uniref:[Ribosomal protein bS18]-alanine N-acetyltransferase n=1 Tax=Tigheibacillus jepli TaxID=3035914 RepID=A0ABU5CJD8_9BACI|nr:ribosomal protein S18-alanine N-acetyltransferase [Virgibacillus sp. 179-BFC.A HS]MDY0406458.1 ribosomal protein S18-alanine N-acetyltransferase [Virgibacillus sp. 179-BFC.A HS]